MPTKTEAIKNFLNHKTLPDLAKLYRYAMEVQVNVAKGKGERFEGSYRGKQFTAWSDGSQIWKSFRIPWKANSTPEYNDSEIKFDLAEHAEGIGLTGWDWESCRSRWVAFDFDAITGHSDKHTTKLTDLELENVVEAAYNIPWVTIRRSTSGSGLHLYVFVDVPTANHNEHAALARAILAQMSAITGFDFNSRIDVCGSVMWIWHSKFDKSECGLELIKEGRVLTEIPINWKDHISVVSGRRKKNKPHFLPENDLEWFDQICGQNQKTPLDEEHKRLIDFLNESDALWWFDSDHHMLVAHSYDLKKAHEKLGMRGIYNTIAKGQGVGTDQNCFSGSTEILTKDGVKKISDLENQFVELYVMTTWGVQWIKSEIKSFGIQKTIPIKFGNNTRVRATLNHLWLYSYNTKFNLLNRKPTYRLLETHIRLPLAKQTLPEIDWMGYAHGFVFGDGWEERNNNTCTVAFHKEDIALLDLVAQYGSSISSRKYNEYKVPAINGLPGDWKNVPKNCTKSYALGFVLGLISADGYIRQQATIYQSNLNDLEKVRKLALYAGLRTRDVRLCSDRYNDFNSGPEYALSIETYNLTRDHFLRKDHKQKLKIKECCFTTGITDIDFEDQIEEKVYCAIVPEWHNFTLGNGVVTGNCFAFPQPNGVWAVRRHTPGVNEDPTWDQDQGGWTRCFLNRDPDLKTIARSKGAMEDENGLFHFQEAEIAASAAETFQAYIDIPPLLRTRTASLKPHKDGRLIFQIDTDPKLDPPKIEGWIKKRGKWCKILDTKIQTKYENEITSHDQLIRHMVSPTEKDAGWVIRADNEWKEEPLAHVKLTLKSTGHSTSEADVIMGAAILRRWKLINMPFSSEYPGDRQWNKNAAQLAFIPSIDFENLQCDTWMKVLNHCGNNLTSTILRHPWCRDNGVITGGEYLKLWIASMFQQPFEPLPYLFFYGEQGSGKSIFHEAIDLLMTRGVARADHALKSKAGFNGELQSSVLCVVEETDLQHDRSTAYDRIKDWTTGRTISIHIKGLTPYSTPNSTHWAQMSNNIESCPIFPGDTRITMLHVDSLTDEEYIPKRDLEKILKSEASDFLASLISMEIPYCRDRLNIPVIKTEDKTRAEKANQNELDAFIEDQCFEIPGSLILWAEFYDRFKEWLDPERRYLWTKTKTGRRTPIKFPKGRNMRDSAKFYVANISWTIKEPDLPYSLDGDKLIQIERNHNVTV